MLRAPAVGLSMIMVMSMLYVCGGTGTEVRLVGGSSPNEGRVEVNNGSGWGTVCDDFWGADDATVVCRQLGYSGGTPYGEAHFGRGSDSILLDNVACYGNESSIADCTHRGWGISNCGHGEDAGVECSEEKVRSYVQCDDKGEIYVDGKLVGRTSGFLWSGVVRSAIVVAIDCYNKEGPGGFRASFSSGLITDDSWKCSGTEEPGWYGMDFDDSHWNSTYVIDDADALRDWQGASDDCRFENAKGIWKSRSDLYSAEHSYCRARRDVDECTEVSTTSPHGPGTPLHKCQHICKNRPWSYECECRDGFSLNEDGRSCTDIDECETAVHDCTGLLQCNNTIGSFHCVCPSGYALDDDLGPSGYDLDDELVDESCVDVDECETDNGGCNFATCENTDGSFVCSCTEGAVLLADHRTCVHTRGSDRVALLVVGVVAGVLLVIVIILVIVYSCKLRRRVAARHDQRPMKDHGERTKGAKRDVRTPPGKPEHMEMAGRHRRAEISGEDAAGMPLDKNDHTTYMNLDKEDALYVNADDDVYQDIIHVEY